MDKEQAIETLRANYPDACYEQLREAVDAAIEALKAQDAAGGAISRRAALDAASSLCDDCDSCYCGSCRVNYPGEKDVIKVLKDLPSAQPEPKEGHWIDKGWNGDWAWQIDGRGNCWRVIECSECGKGGSVESNYCPHCGARMKGE